MASIKSLQDDRDAHDLIEQLSLGVKLMSGFLTRLDSHARARLNHMNETLTHIDRHASILQAKQSSTLDPPAARLQHSADVSPHDSASALADGLQDGKPPPMLLTSSQADLLEDAQLAAGWLGSADGVGGLDGAAAEAPATGEEGMSKRGSTELTNSQQLHVAEVSEGVGRASDEVPLATADPI
ncbi:hypothetical protein HDU87_005265 [Geranomyces variabilis]|uniref:Uncharacterized protein n=1 Tax=Geranomyces variabilis TaxID=109894 RepID=A0AAD5XPD3_9FUNG|nr:hypothetical protein HDU87_005265 [Geranomyces variabilis]